jgi:DNA mismatch repair protein MutL
MAIIKQLNPLEARKIAAGEVIERPVNILKELIENSIDAGATNILLKLKSGGLEYISITDDGHGIFSDDVAKAFMQHYTSKINCLDDLWSVNSYGFRGEALSSIAAISNVTMFTKHQNEAKATCFKTGPDGLNKSSLTSRSTGTTIVIENLFDNVPARKKFQKTAETEYRLIHQMVQTFALNYPNIYFEIKHNEKTTLQITVSDEKSRIYNTLELKDHDLCRIKIAEKDIELDCWFSSPEVTKYNRQGMVMFVNNRAVKNSNLMKAIMRGYGNTIGEKFPYAVVKIKVDSKLVDVNVHPKKEEVRFAQEGRLLALLTQACSQALQNRSHQILNRFEGGNRQIENSITTLSNLGNREIITNQIQSPANSFVNNNFVRPDSMQAKNYQFDQQISRQIKNPDQDISTNYLIDSTEIQAQINNAQIKLEFEDKIEQNKYLGSLANTYLLLNSNEGLLIIDQHAAHERIMFEAIENYFTNPTTIQLLFPLIINTADTTEWFMAEQDVFEKMGIHFAQIEEQKIAINSIPIFLKNKRLDEIFAQIAHETSKLTVTDRQIKKTVLQLVQSTVACKAAIKAGDILTTSEAEKLFKDLQNCQNAGSCPHGRPTSYLFLLKDIAKEFRRFI